MRDGDGWKESNGSLVMDVNNGGEDILEMSY